MKVKEIAEKYQIDEMDFDRFLLIKQMPCKKTFSGTVIADEDVERYVTSFHEYQNSFKQKVIAASEEKRVKAERFAQKMQSLFTLKGNRGRTLTVCKNKCIIKTDVTVGSVVTGNATDGEKIIFFKHCSGLQFKESGLAIGYLQFETPSMQMNNQGSNFFSENTFTFEENGNGITSAMMREVFYYVMELVENCQTGTDCEAPELPALLTEYLNTHQ